jgi:hypothetical protein
MTVEELDAAGATDPGEATVVLKAPGEATVVLPAPGEATVVLPAPGEDETVPLPSGPGESTVRLPTGPGEQTVLRPTGPGEQTVVLPSGPGEPTVRMPAGPGEDTVRLRGGPVVPRQRGPRRGPPSAARPAGTGTPPPAPEPPPTHRVVLPRVSTDPLDELVDRIRPALARAVDALQVAAALEADGLTDRAARVEYGFADVFALAGEVFRRLGPPAEDAAGPDRVARDWRHSVRLLAHGPLYALPAVVFPAVLGVLGHRSVVTALIVAGVLGWTAAGTAAYAAYRLLGAGRPRAADRLLRAATLAAPAAGGLAGLAVLAVAGGGWGLLPLAAGQLAYQMAGTVLMFHRREGLQAAVMMPAVVAGGAYLVGGAAARPVAVTAAAAGVVAAYSVALWLVRDRDGDAEPPAGPVLRGDRAGLVGVTWYGLCSAALFLHPTAPYLADRLDIAVAVAPLIGAMGFVEWRAERFRAVAVGLTRRTRTPWAFQRRVWLVIGRETLTCLAATAALGTALLAVLAGIGRLTPAAAVMTAAHVVLGGAYYAAFLLAGFERFGRLCASLLVALALHVGGGAVLGVAPLLGRSAAPLTDAALHLGSVLALQVLFLLGLVPVVGQVRHHR